MLTHNRLNTYMVLISGDLNKAQIYKMPYRDCPHHETEIVMSFNYLNAFEPNDYHIRKPNDEIFLFEIEDKINVYVVEKVFSSETNGIIVKFS